MKKQDSANDGSVPLEKLAWEKFCQLYVASCAGNASEAYRIAFESKSKNVNVLAPRLLANVRIKARIEYLRGQLEMKLALNREEWLKSLVTMHKDAKEEGVKLRSLETIGKAQGYFAPEKKEVTGHVSLLSMFEALDGTANTLEGKAKK